MNKDFRVTISFPYHPKTKKLVKRLGCESVYSLITLWSFAAMNKPNGILSDMDVEDIEIAAGWDGDPGEFVKVLIELNFLDFKNNKYFVHNWEKRQPDILRELRYKELGEKLYSPDWNRRRYEVFVRDNFICQYCGMHIVLPHIDHIIPRSRGGSDNIDNLATSCPVCNLKKGNKTLEEWLR